MSKPRPGPVDTRSCAPRWAPVNCRPLPGHHRETLSASTGNETWLPQDLPHGFTNQSRTGDLRIFRTRASVETKWAIAEAGEAGPIATKHEMG